MSAVPIRFQNTYTQLPDRFFARQQPTPVPAPVLIRVNAGLAASLGLDAEWLGSSDGLAMLSGNRLPEGADPIAQAYAGHQFGGFNPQLGDGRALLLGEVVDARSGARFDLQLKGSGQTPFSRRGDGKSALGPVLREYVVSEAMAALGVPTTRALAAVSTGERVFRQEGAVPGGVFTRVAASHLRVGTFEYFRARNDIDALRRLADYAIARHYPHVAGASTPYPAFLAAVALAQAELIAHWLSLGFIHGVMNTDNTAISGQTIDYGPCAFMDAFHGQRVFSSIDSGGRYAWGNQPDIGFWNVARLADTLVPLFADDVKEATAIAEAAIAGYGEHFDRAVLTRFRAKLGVSPDAPRELIEDCLGLLESQQVDFTLFFRRLTQVAAGESPSVLAAMFAEGDAFAAWFGRWQVLVDPATGPAAMRGSNPVRIPRNHRIEQAIQAAYGGDFTPFHRLVDALAQAYDELAEFADYEVPPQPAEVVRRTFCGT